MKRKVNRVGSSTLTVSLPSKLVKRYGVKAGDEVDVEERGGVLSIGKSLRVQERETVVRLPSSGQFLRRFLVIPFINGYTAIRLEYSDQKNYAKIQDTVNKLLLGFEIVDHGQNYCLVKNIAEGIEAELEAHVRQYFHKVRNLIESLIVALEGRDKESLEHVLNLDAGIDKLCVFIMRGCRSGEKNASMYSVVYQLENIGDHCKGIAEKVLDGSYPGPKFTKVFRKVQESIEFYFSLFVKPDFAKVSQLSSMYKTNQKEIIPLVSGKDAIYFHYLLSITELIHSLTFELE